MPLKFSKLRDGDADALVWIFFLTLEQDYTMPAGAGCFQRNELLAIHASPTVDRFLHMLLCEGCSRNHPSSLSAGIAKRVEVKSQPNFVVAMSIA